MLNPDNHALLAESLADAIVDSYREEGGAATFEDVKRRAERISRHMADVSEVWAGAHELSTDDLMLTFECLPRRMRENCVRRALA